MSELYHHGILGQRWGVRRYQNKDGTLTPEGKERREELDINDEEARKAKVESLRKKNELLRLIQENNELMTKLNKVNVPPEKESRVKKLISDVMFNSIKTVATKGLVELGNYVVGKGLTKIGVKKDTTTGTGTTTTKAKRPIGF